MAELDLYDILKLEDYNLSVGSGDVSVEIINGGGEFASILSDIPAEKNFITIAVKKYMNAIGRGGHFIFKVTKNIPSGAGLGGGSSNAASALKIITKELNRDFDDDFLKAASDTGSDVPFFIDGGFAFVEGRGESVTPMDFDDKSFILLVNNGIHINTGFAYESLNKSVTDVIMNCSDRKKRMSEIITLKAEWKNIFKNNFEETIFRSYPEIGLIKKKMYQNGAFFALMSGSGSTVFGLFKDEHSAENAHKILENEGNKVYMTNFRSRKN